MAFFPFTGLPPDPTFLNMAIDVFELFTSSHTPLFLAPQAGVSEAPFRRLCRRFGADVVSTEFVSADGIMQGNRQTREHLRFSEDERPIGIQIFGSDPKTMGEASALVTDLFGPDFIDINFGCPVKKIVKRNGGSGCLRDLDLVERIIRSVVRNTHLPVTTKIRSGYDEPSRDPVGIALRCRDAGSRMVTLHARTRTDMYGGQARWDEIAALVEYVRWLAIRGEMEDKLITELAADYSIGAFNQRIEETENANDQQEQEYDERLAEWKKNKQGPEPEEPEEVDAEDAILKELQEFLDQYYQELVDLWSTDIPSAWNRAEETVMFPKKKRTPKST